MNGFRNPPKSVVFLLMVTLESCMSYMPLKEPYGETIKSLKKGDMLELTMTNGVYIPRIRVEQVWADSLLLGTSTQATRISEISKIKKRQVHPGATILAIAAPLAILFIAVSNMHFSTGSWGPGKI